MDLPRPLAATAARPAAFRRRAAARRHPSHQAAGHLLLVRGDAGVAARARQALEAAGFDVVLERAPAAPAAPDTPPASAVAIRIGELVVDPAARSVRVGDAPVALTTTEFDLLLHLARRRGRAVTRDELLRLVLDRDASAVSRTVDTHVSTIRRKLGDDPARPRFLHTVRGYGYRADG